MKRFETPGCRRVSLCGRESGGFVVCLIFIAAIAAASAERTPTMTLAWNPDPKAPECQSALLNGWWEFAPIYDAAQINARPSSYPERILVPSFWNMPGRDIEGDWKAYRNFNWPEKWSEARAAGYRRMFPLAPRVEGQVLRIRFDAVIAEADVYINGERVLQIDDGFLPFEADVTYHVNWGAENTMEVVVREQPKKDGQYLRPSGSWVGWNLRGIWQDCSLRIEPAVRLADVWVKPSVRNKTLSVVATVENASTEPRTVLVAHHVDGVTVELKSGPALVAAGESLIVEAEVSWADPKLWSPDEPNLYWLESTLEDAAAKSAALDFRRTRFGFKEFWLDGLGFVLNGNPIRFKGDSWHYMGAAQQTPEYARQWFTMVKEIGANAVRLHAMPHPEFYLDIADEMGICLIDESAVYGSGGNLALKADAFWDSARDHVRRLARRDRNHPSVCLWSACNEIVWRGGEESYPKLLSLETAIQEIDPTRPVSFDENNSDMGGGAKIYGGHYGNPAAWAQHWKKNKPLMVNEFSCLYYSGPEEPSMWGGEECYADFDARTRGGGEDAAETILGLRALGAASLTPWNFVWYGLDPAFPPETVELNPDPTGPGIKTQRIGANSVSLNYDVAPGKALDPKAKKRIQPNAAFDVMRRGYAAQATFLREAHNNVFDGQTLVRHVDVYNDVSRAEELVLGWSLGDLAKGKLDLPMGVYEQRLVELEIPVPTLKKAVTAPLTLTLRAKKARAKDKPLHATSIDYWIVPRSTSPIRGVAAKNRTIALIDASGETAGVLQQLGLVFESVAGMDEESLDAISKKANATLVVGKGQLRDATLNQLAKALIPLGFFERGGVVVALEGAFAKDVDSPLNPVEREAMRAWRRSVPEFWSDIPGDEMLRYWGQDGTVPWRNGAVTKTMFLKPSRGAFVPLAETADGGEGLEYSPLLWLPLEKGGVFVNGLTLVDNATRHPAAARLLERLVTTSADYTVTSARKASTASGDGSRSPVAVVSGNNTDLRYVSERVGVDCTTLDGGPRVIALDGTVPEVLAGVDAEEMRKELNDGGCVILSTTTPETLAFAKKLSGLDLALAEGPWENVAKAKGMELDPALQGISQDDLTWVRRGQSETICHSAFAMTKGLEPLVVTVDVKWAGYAESAEQFKYALMLRRRAAFKGSNTVVGRVKVGKGELILSQLEVGKARKFTDKARRVWSLLLANAGATFADEASPLLERRSPYVDDNGYIRRWLVVGAFGGVEQEKLLLHDFLGGETTVRPVEGAAVAGKTWSPHTAGQPAIDLRDALKGQPAEKVAGYMAVYVHSLRARDLILETPDMVDLAVGSDDGVRAWLNGEVILSVDAMRPWQADQERVKGVKLREGWNLLLLKITQGGADWRASARFLTSSGFPVSDLTYSLKPN